jgi:hypothetical protein
MAWSIAGIVMIGISLLLWLVQRQQLATARSINSARFATVAELTHMSQEIAQEIGGGSWRDYVKVLGTIECDRPLISELKQEPCVYYTMSVRRDYEETVIRTDSKGKSHRERNRSSEIVATNSQRIPFELHDATGKIEVNPNGADIDSIKILDEFRPDQSSSHSLRYGSSSSQTQERSGQRGDRQTLGYRYSESIMPVGRRVLVVGEVSDYGGILMLKKPTTSDQRWLISFKTDDELTAKAEQNAQHARIAMMFFGVVGVVSVILGLFL